MPPRASVILERIRRVPPGFVTTYGDVSPGAPRLTGQVLRTCSDETVPWWRVVRSDGTVAKGERQLALLRAEDVPLRGPARVDLAAARIPPDAIL